MGPTECIPACSMFGWDDVVWIKRNVIQFKMITMMAKSISKYIISLLSLSNDELPVSE